MKRPRQHIVPRLLIRRFCGRDGKVFVFDKQAGRIVGRRPAKHVLAAAGYYCDARGDLDAAWLQTIEAAFGAVLIRADSAGADEAGRVIRYRNASPDDASLEVVTQPLV